MKHRLSDIHWMRGTAGSDDGYVSETADANGQPSNLPTDQDNDLEVSSQRDDQGIYHNDQITGSNTRAFMMGWASLPSESVYYPWMSLWMYGAQFQQSNGIESGERCEVGDDVGQRDVPNSAVENDCILGRIEDYMRIQTPSEEAAAQATWWAERLWHISAFYAEYGCGLALGYCREDDGNEGYYHF
ncbi:hypothetical protein BKA62DRAFT_757130, partial [Auriculariales sp. MPI-PUGE-AT-0066]